MRLILSFAFILFLSSIALAQAAPDHIILISQISVIDTTGASAWSSIRADQDVLIVGDRIQQVSPRRLIKPDGAEVVDGRGKFLIPGLWDMHVHVQELDRSFPLFIANGVLGVRDMGGNLDDLLRWWEQIKAGQLLGPQMVISGLILDGELPADPQHAIPVTTVDQARKIVQQRAAAGANFLKTYDGLAGCVFRHHRRGEEAPSSRRRTRTQFRHGERGF